MYRTFVEKVVVYNIISLLQASTIAGVGWIIIILLDLNENALSEEWELDRNFSGDDNRKTLQKFPHKAFLNWIKVLRLWVTGFSSLPNNIRCIFWGLFVIELIEYYI